MRSKAVGRLNSTAYQDIPSVNSILLRNCGDSVVEKSLFCVSVLFIGYAGFIADIFALSSYSVFCRHLETEM